MIIVDDCSTDDSVNIVQSFIEQDSRIKIIRLAQNSGPTVARNTAVEVANGRYIAFLDSDDKWCPDKLSMQIAVMEEKNYNFTYSDYIIINQENGKSIPFESILDKVTYSDEVKFNYIACSTVIYNQANLGKNYMPDLRNRQDWALWIQLLKKTDAAYRINKKLTIYLQRTDSISSRKFKLVKYHWLIYRRFLAKNFLTSLYLLIRNITLHLNYGYRKKAKTNFSL
ncbi:unnamed protein product [marine sediment metagenome]|uniref:Glycosyltransferase 2-like domain-containing protein n=1 Tax=marine sediment metagenome TaxID=412755 RepID=X0Z5R9_9ZZZZ